MLTPKQHVEDETAFHFLYLAAIAFSIMHRPPEEIDPELIDAITTVTGDLEFQEPDPEAILTSSSDNELKTIIRQWWLDSFHRPPPDENDDENLPDITLKESFDNNQEDNEDLLDTDKIALAFLPRPCRLKSSHVLPDNSANIIQAPKGTNEQSSGDTNLAENQQDESSTAAHQPTLTQSTEINSQSAGSEACTVAIPTPIYPPPPPQYLPQCEDLIQDIITKGTYLGTGTHGTTYLTLNPWNENEYVAVKINLSQTATEEYIQKISYAHHMFEVGVLRKLRHDGIIKMIGYMTYPKQDRCLIYLEYLPHSLLDLIYDPRKVKARLTDRKLTSPTGFLTIFTTYFDTMNFLMSQNMIHADISSSNIRFTERGEFKLIDFNVVMRADAPTPISGAEHFHHFPPEVRAGGVHTMASLVYSAGILMISLLQGRYIEPYSTLTFVIEHFRKVENKGSLLTPFLITEPIAVQRIMSKALETVAYPACQKAPDSRPTNNMIYKILSTLIEECDSYTEKSGQPEQNEPEPDRDENEY